jgi:hypothetical protein
LRDIDALAELKRKMNLVSFWVVMVSCGGGSLWKKSPPFNIFFTK